MELTDAQWAVVEPLIPKPKRRPDGKGRPPCDPRDVLEGILWILRTGAPWPGLPERFPSYQACHRWFQRWERDGTILPALKALAQDLEERGGIDLSERFVDAAFASAKRGALESARRSAEKAPKSWRSRTALVFQSPFGLSSASPGGVALVDDTLDGKFTVDHPERLIGDMAYDSDEHDQWLKGRCGIETIAPHNPSRKTKTQDGRPLRRYKRRWKVERLFACFRRIVVRWERKLESYTAFVHLGCVLILLRQY
jgi:transposase